MDKLFKILGLIFGILFIVYLAVLFTLNKWFGGLIGNIAFLGVFIVWSRLMMKYSRDIFSGMGNEKAGTLAGTFKSPKTGDIVHVLTKKGESKQHAMSRVKTSHFS